ncbi:MAG: CehA/McbA family metallohydrolase [Dehalococcoidia bacterium]
MPTRPRAAQLSPQSFPLSTSNWYRGDLHSHTDHSDGENTIAEMAAFAKKRGLDSWPSPTTTSTTYMPVIDALEGPAGAAGPGRGSDDVPGHANVRGLRDRGDFRFTTTPRSTAAALGRIARPAVLHQPPEEGGVSVLAVLGPGFGVREVRQAPWRWYNRESVHAWDEQLAAGRRIVPVGGSDAHSAPPATPRHPHHIGDPTTWLYCDGGLTEAAVLDAITAGRTSISDGPRGPFLTLTRDDEGRVTAEFERAGGCTLEFVADAERTLRVELRKAKGVVQLPREIRFERYLRAELRVPAERNREDVRALCAPIYAD